MLSLPMFSGILGGQLVSQGLGKIKLWPFFFPLCHSDNETGLYMYVYKYIVLTKPGPSMPLRPYCVSQDLAKRTVL
jgi:hypothetical protein